MESRETIAWPWEICKNRGKFSSRKNGEKLGMGTDYGGSIFCYLKNWFSDPFSENVGQIKQVLVKKLFRQTVFSGNGFYILIFQNPNLVNSKDDIAYPYSMWYRQNRMCDTSKEKKITELLAINLF